jgi:hypothetical protein
MSLYTNSPSHHNYHQSHHTQHFTLFYESSSGDASEQMPPPPKKKKYLLTKLKQNMLQKRRAKATRFVTFALYMAGALPLSKHYNVTSSPLLLRLEAQLELETHFIIRYNSENWEANTIAVEGEEFARNWKTKAS